LAAASSRFASPSRAAKSPLLLLRSIASKALQPERLMPSNIKTGNKSHDFRSNMFSPSLDIFHALNRQVLQYFEFFRKLFIEYDKVQSVKEMNKLSIINLGFLDRGPYNLDVAAASVNGIRGSSGAGKTLLLRAIADLEPHTGDMRLNGVCYQSFSGPEWRRKVAYLPAESHWWFETAGQHFLKKPTLETLQKLGFEPEVMDWEISRLSTGEKQRLAVLRILQNFPEILLLDEPTASLDEKNIKAVEALLIEYVKENNAACLVVSHDSEQLARIADHRYEILNGGEMRAIE